MAPRDGLKAIAQRPSKFAPMIFHDANNYIAAGQHKAVRLIEHCTGLTGPRRRAEVDLQSATLGARRNFLVVHIALIL